MSDDLSDFKGGYSKESQLARVNYEDAVARYSGGETTVSIAASYGVSATAVAVGLKRRGIVLRQHWEVQPYPKALQLHNVAKKAQTHCKRGHEFTDENTYETRGMRQCRQCQREQQAASRARNVERGLTRHGRVPGSPRATPHPEPVPRPVACPKCGLERVLKHDSGRDCRDCQYASMRTGRNQNCEHCGKKFWVIKKRIGRARWCSLECKVNSGYAKTELGPKLSLSRGGDGNPAYKHGRRVDIQIPGWKLNNKGEGRVCRNCGGRERVQLHHAIPRSKARHVRADLRNGVPLCGDCHTGWHSSKVTIYRDIFSEEEWAFISGVELIGENIGPWLDRRYPEREVAA